MRFVPGWVWPNVVMLSAVGVYLWWRLVKGTTARRSTARTVWTVGIVLLTALGPVPLIAQYALPITTQRVIAPVGWLGYALIVFLATATVLTEPVRVWWWWKRGPATRAAAVSGVTVGTPVARTVFTPPTGLAPVPGEGIVAADPADPADRADRADPADRADRADPAAPDRRVFLQRALAVSIGAAATVATGIGARSALGGPAVRTATITLQGIPAAADGLRVALVSDLHIGSVLRADFCRSVVDLVNRQRPDVICLVGDLSDGRVTELGEDLRPLADLSAPDGVFFVTGNHEFYFDPDGWLAFLPQLGMRVLANDAAQVRGILLAGVHDIAGRATGRGPDMDAALAQRAPEQPVLLMSHSPNLVGDAVDRDVQLMVSGHTHGGQFFPSTLAVAATSKAVSGHYVFGPTQVFVTNGAGFWGPIARLGAPPDITILTLVVAGTNQRG